MRDGELIFYTAGELTAAATCKERLQVREKCGGTVNRSRRSHSNELMLAVGHRVRAPRCTRSGQRATTPFAST